MIFVPSLQGSLPVEQFPSSGSAGGHPRVEESGDMMPVTGVCLSQARPFPASVMFNGLFIRAPSLMYRADLPEFTAYNPVLHILISVRNECAKRAQ